MKIITRIFILCSIVACTETTEEGNLSNDAKSDNIAEEENNTDVGSDADVDTDTDADADTDADTDTDVDGDSAGEQNDGDDPGASLVGTWGELRVLASVGKNIPIVGQTWTSTRAWFLVEINSDGKGNLTLTEYGCAARAKTSTEGGSFSAKDSQLQILLPEERFVTVASSKSGTPFVSNIQYATKGLNLCDPAQDNLPDPSGTKTDSTPCDGPCTGSHCDEDGDSHPGVTASGTLLNTIKCDVYLSGVTISKMAGDIVDADNIQGHMTDMAGYQVIHEATNPLCVNNGAPISADDCADHHYFKLTRLADGATCKEVMELTDCDENETNCDTNTKLPLDPNPDTPACN